MSALRGLDADAAQALVRIARGEPSWSSPAILEALRQCGLIRQTAIGLWGLTEAGRQAVADLPR